ncbi:MAG: DGQHR domain-containing protein [Gammaproteobacteria bacterium]|nr:DGQHR domain-containing protein [Gammaproteobacteria bacterium]
MKSKVDKSVPAIKVPQWLDEWNDVTWDSDNFRRQPERAFYLFSIPASELRALCGVYPRSIKGREKGRDEHGIQRRHDPDRSHEIASFIKYGYPWSDLSQAKRESGKYDDLKKPGWLPTAVVVNILGKDDKRRGKKVEEHDLVTLVGHDGQSRIHFPENFTGKDWRAAEIPPLEVIDGQHRLWAFDEENASENYHLPVVAFNGLDISWQAYLFYTINIKPKKINASLAFDLYPLLRTEDWLEKFEGHVIYRETRAQEIVDLLWSSNTSPWFHRINMLGESGQRGRMVSQAAWVRSLLASLIKSWEGQRVTIGGLFGAPVGSHKQTLPWSRTQQASFVIFAGDSLKRNITNSKHAWMNPLRESGDVEEGLDAAFYGSKTLINQDQGIRVFLHAINDLCYVNADELGLAEWGDTEENSDDIEKIKSSFKSLKKSQIGEFIEQVTEQLAEFDWRASDAPGLSEDDRLKKAAFRGSGGYKELRRQLLAFLSQEDNLVGSSAKLVLKSLGYA